MFQDKLLLEPYGRPRDVAYVVVAPDNEFILSQVRSFFKEMSTMYELLKLGRHCPISKVLRDGIMRVGKTAASKVADKQVDEWFTLLGECTSLRFCPCTDSPGVVQDKVWPKHQAFDNL